MKKYFKNKKGLSLIEVLIYISIVSISIVSFVSYSLLMVTLSEKNKIVSSVENDARNILNSFQKYIINANALTFPQSGEASSTLILDIVGTSTPIKFYVLDNILFVEEAPEKIYRIESDGVVINNLEFFVSEENEKNVKISFILKNQQGSSREFQYEKKYYDSFKLRR